MSGNLTIKSARFKTGVNDIGVYFSVAESYNCPEICVAGRSNVGKSSFINLLAGQKKLAKTSSTPGRTRMINLFDFILSDASNPGCAKDFVLVDLPGYGYAEAQKEKIDKWSQLIDRYFSESKKLCHTFSLVDIRHEPSALDKQLIKFLYASGLPFTVVATKADKIPKSKIAAHLQIIAAALCLGVDNILLTSADANIGKEAVLSRIGQVLGKAAEV